MPPLGRIGSIGDYPYPPGNNAASAPIPSASAGPVQRPIVPPPMDQSAQDCCSRILALLTQLVQAQTINKAGAIVPLNQSVENVLDFFRDTMPSGTGVRSFWVPSGAPTAVAAAGSAGNGTATLCSLLVNEGDYGILQEFQVDISPPSSASDISVQINVSGEVESKLSGNTLSPDLVGVSQKFYRKIQPGATVSLTILNSGTGAVNATARISGFLRPTRG